MKISKYLKLNPAMGICVLGFLSATPGHAALIYWDGNGGDWNTLSKWSTDATGAADPSTVPGSLDTAHFNITGQNSNQTVTLGGSQAALGLVFASTGTTSISGSLGVDDLTLGSGGITLNTGAGAVSVDALTILTSNNTALNVADGTMLSFSSNITTTYPGGDFNVPKSGLGTLNITGGEMYATGNTPNRIFNITQGRVNFTNATIHLSSLITQTNNNAYLASTNTTFDVNDTGWPHGGLILGWGNGFYSYAMNGGSFTMQGSGVQMMGSGNTGRALLSLDGGVNVTSPYFFVANNDNCVGVLNVRSATVTNAGTMRLGASKAIGIVNQFAGLIDNGGALNLDYRMNQANNWGIYNLRGGILKTNRITSGDGTSNFGAGNHAYFNFHGGTLSPKVASTNFVFSTLTGVSSGTVSAPQLMVYSAGADIDTLGSSITINQPLLAPPGQGVSNLTIPIAPANQGSGYKGEPVVRPELTPGGLTNVTATAVANMVDDGTGNGTFKIASITVTNPGVNYATAPSLNIYGGDPTTPATPPALTLAPNVSGGLTKRGDGVLTLGGINTYTGDTVVEGGAIDLADNAGIKFVVTNSSNNKITGSAPGQIFLKGDFTIDLSAVSVGTGTWNLVDVAAAGAVFDSATFTVIGFTDPEQDGIWTLVDGPNTWTFTQADGNLRLNPVALTPYEEWINGYSGTIILSQRDPGDDPDGDGASNLLEFAFKGRPDDSSSTGLFYAEQKDNADVGTAKELTFTCAMRAAPTVGFTANGNGAQHADALISGLDYIIEADVDMLGTWSSNVSYIGRSPVPPAGSGLEDLTGDQWEYRTFSAFDGLPGIGFIRGRVSMP